MKEVLTLQFGSASTRLAEELWRSSLFESANDKLNETSDDLDTTLKYRNGRCVPRAVAFGCKGDFNRGKPQNRTNEASVWDGNVQIVSKETDSNEIATIIPPRSVVEVNEFRSFDPLNNYYDGIASVDGKIRRETLDIACDAVRVALEECDSIQGIQAIVDIDSTWGGFATEVIKEIREECPSTFLCCLGLDERYPLVAQIGSFDQSKQNSRRAINIASSLLSLNELSSLFVPFSPTSYSSGSIAWDCMSSIYRSSGDSHMRDLVFRPSSKFFELPGQNKISIWDSNSSLPAAGTNRSTSRKFHFQFVTLRGTLDYAKPPLISGSPFGYWQSAIIPKSLHLPNTLARPCVHAVSSLSITDRVSHYLEDLARNVLNVDRRVVHEFTQSGMSCDGGRDMHSELMTLCDSSS
ncbi:Aste57867_5450 [Aphanomyces stellatus]|uniref:Aste57867_5450 protein n=1 Tax=Aphanomyces stellatus TaxID=120398 RepID=A0A485KEL4_9STRA|nr:hypothetical protein As57867_005437 [Aphanomyces stellatus]VFT82502.1 Aste57867_5450 [Aphanomyces stellatus]